MPTVKGREPKVAVKHVLGTKLRATPVYVTTNNTILTPVYTSHRITIRQVPSFTLALRHPSIRSDPQGMQSG